MPFRATILNQFASGKGAHELVIFLRLDHNRDVPSARHELLAPRRDGFAVRANTDVLHVPRLADIRPFGTQNLVLDFLWNWSLVTVSILTQDVNDPFQFGRSERRGSIFRREVDHGRRGLFVVDCIESLVILPIRLNQVAIELVALLGRHVGGANPERQVQQREQSEHL